MKVRKMFIFKEDSTPMCMLFRRREPSSTSASPIKTQNNLSCLLPKDEFCNTDGTGALEQPIHCTKLFAFGKIIPWLPPWKVSIKFDLLRNWLVMHSWHFFMFRPNKDRKHIRLVNLTFQTAHGGKARSAKKCTVLNFETIESYLFFNFVARMNLHISM